MSMVNLEQANTIAAAALAKGREIGLKPLCVAVLGVIPAHQPRGASPCGVGGRRQRLAGGALRCRTLL